MEFLEVWSGIQPITPMAHTDVQQEGLSALLQGLNPKLHS